MVLKKAPKEPKPLSFATANPSDTVPREVQVDTGNWDEKDGKTTESPVDGQDQPKINEIGDHTLEVLMHPSVLELHDVRVVRTPRGDERQLHLKVRVMCGQKEVGADVLVDTGAQISLVRNGLFSDVCLQSSDSPVRLKVANGRIMGGGSREAEFGLEFREHDRFDRPDQAKHLMLHGKFYEADHSDLGNPNGLRFHGQRFSRNIATSCHTHSWGQRQAFMAIDPLCHWWIPMDRRGKRENCRCGESGGNLVQMWRWRAPSGVWSTPGCLSTNDASFGYGNTIDGSLRITRGTQVAEIREVLAQG